MSDTAEVGLRIVLEDLASSGLKAITNALDSLGFVASSLLGDIGPLDSALQSMGGSADVAAIALDGFVGSLRMVSQDALITQNILKDLPSYNSAVEISFQQVADQAGKTSSSLSDISGKLDGSAKSAGNATTKVKEYDDALTALGQNTGNVGASVQGFNATLDEEKQATSDTSDNFMQLMGVQMAAQTLYDNFSGTLKNVIDNAGELQSTMTGIQMSTGATDGQMSALQDNLIAVENTAMWSLSQTGQAFETLGQRGYDAADIINNNLGATAVHFAEATQSDLIPATELLASTMQAFGASAADAGNYADALTFAFYNGIPSINDLSTALNNVSGEATALNIPMEDVVTTLDYLVRNGLSASTAGSSLRYMLSALTEPTDKAIEGLSNLNLISVHTGDSFYSFQAALQAAADAAGVTPKEFDGTTYSLLQMFKQARDLGAIHTDQTFYQWAVQTGNLSSALFDAKGNLISLPGMIQAVSDALQNAPNDATKIADIMGIYNVKSSQGALHLTSPQANQDLKKLNTGVKTAEKTDESTAFASKVEGNWNTQTKALASSFNDLLAVIGEPLIGALSGVVGWMDKLIPGFIHSDEAVKRFIAGFLVAGAIASFIVVVVTLMVVLQMFNPVTLGVVAAVLAVAVVAGFIAANWKAVVEVMRIAAIVLAAAIGIVAAAFLISLLPALVILIPFLVITVVNILLASGPFLLIAGAALLVGGAIYFAAQKFLNLHNIIHTGQIFWNAFMHTMQGIASGVMQHLQTALQKLQPTWNQLVQAFMHARPLFMMIAAVLGGLVALVLGLGIAIVNGLLHSIAPILGVVIGVIAGVMRVFMGLVTFFLGFFTLLFGLFTGNFTLIQQGWTSMGNGIRNIVAGLWNIVVAIFKGGLNLVVGFVTGFISGIVGFFTHLFNVLVGHSIIPDLINSIVSWISGLPGKALGFVGNLVSGFISHVQQLPGKIGEIAGNVGTTLINGITNIGPNLLNAGANLMNMLGNGIKNAAGAVTNAVSGVASSIANFLGFSSPTKEGPMSKSDRFMPNMMNMFASGILQHKHLVTNAVGSVATGIQNGLATPAVQNLQYAGAQANNGNQVINLNIDGKKVGQVFINQLTGQMQMNGMTRSLR